MNKVVEEALTSMIKRIEVLEEKISRKPIPNTPIRKPATSPTNHSQATVGQIGYINNLKGETWEGMTKKEAGIEIDRLLNKEPSRRVHEIIAEKVIKEQSKQLTKEQIAELGEENLL